jgi:hypothetical protein
MSKSELDPNKIIAEIIQLNLGDIKKGWSSFFSTTWVKFERAFKGYIKRTHKKYSKTKTLLYKNDPVNLMDIYVATGLKVGEKNILTDKISELFDISNRLLVTGTAGSGKSIFLKYLFLQSLKEKKLGVPVFIELRLLNNANVGLLEFLQKNLSGFSLNLTLEQIRVCLKMGRFILILDGYDELSRAIRDDIAREIIEISNEFEKVKIVVSSRPDENLSAWEDFTAFKVLPMDKGRAVELVTKLKYDKKVKVKFVEQLEKGLFEKHIDFLSNPLLMTIMLLTYGQIAEIPEKMHIFYDQAFDALFFKHDAHKSVFKRTMYTDLAIDDFKKALGAFSLLSYLKGDISFTNTSVNTYFSQAKKISGVTFTNRKYLDDLLKSVCIFTSEGLLFTYTHRSFQEYFAALFLLTMEKEKRGAVYERLIPNIDQDNVCDLIFEMNREVLEKELIMPQLKSLIEKYDQIDEGGEDYFFKIANIWLESLSIRYDCKHKVKVVSGFDFKVEGKIASKVERFYRDIYPKIFPSFRRQLTYKLFRETFGSDNVYKEIRVTNPKSGDLEICKKLKLDVAIEAMVKFSRQLYELLLKKHESREDKFAELFGLKN